MSIPAITPNVNNIKYNNPQAGLYGRNNTSFGASISVPKTSKIDTPFKKVFNWATDKIAQYWTSKVYTSGLAKNLADWTKNSDSVIPVMSVLGSAVISGMYMLRTLNNKQLDDRRKKTLAINQGLTFGLSTLLSLAANKGIDKWWEGLTVKYAQSRLNEQDFAKNLKLYNEELVKQNKKSLKTLDYLEKFYAENTTMIKRVKGMGIFKSLAVFGFIYRYLSPVAVTPFANWLGNKWFSDDKNNKKA